jgi:hypothetical protein
MWMERVYFVMFASVVTVSRKKGGDLLRRGVGCPYCCGPPLTNEIGSSEGVVRVGRHTPGAKARRPWEQRRPKAKALGYLDAKA